VQYHVNGYTFGDPTVEEAGPQARRPGDPLPEAVDVLIVGTGPAGAVLTAQLARFATAWPAAPWRCSSPSGWPPPWWTRPTG
jgi:hypothetical protein